MNGWALALPGGVGMNMPSVVASAESGGFKPPVVYQPAHTIPDMRQLQLTLGKGSPQVHTGRNAESGLSPSLQPLGKTLLTTRLLAGRGQRGPWEPQDSSAGPSPSLAAPPQAGPASQTPGPDPLLVPGCEPPPPQRGTRGPGFRKHNLLPGEKNLGDVLGAT